MPATTASISPALVVRSHVVHPELNQENLTIEAPNGWDDVKKICRKVLIFDARRFTFTGWNSDENVAYFVRPLDSEVKTAVVAR